MLRQALKVLLAQNFQDALSEIFDHFLRVTKARELAIPQDVVKTILDDYFAVRAGEGQVGDMTMNRGNCGRQQLF